jgi:hypothetical protein
MLTKAATAALAMGIGLAGLATPAAATTILIFAENGTTPPGFVILNDNGNGTTSLATDIPVSITDLSGPLVPPVITDATFQLTGHSTDFATETPIGGGFKLLTQSFSGTFSITAPQCGTVCLAGTFVDVMAGPVGGFALTLAASTPPEAGLTFTSDTIPAEDIVLDRAMALSETALTNPVTSDCSSPLGCTLDTTSANVSGTFSATPTNTPEPSTWVMMVLGFAGLGFTAYRSSRSKIALID